MLCDEKQAPNGSEDAEQMQCGGGADDALFVWLYMPKCEQCQQVAGDECAHSGSVGSEACFDLELRFCVCGGEEEALCLLQKLCSVSLQKNGNDEEEEQKRYGNPVGLPKEGMALQGLDAGVVSAAFAVQQRMVLEVSYFIPHRQFFDCRVGGFSFAAGIEERVFFGMFLQ